MRLSLSGLHVKVQTQRNNQDGAEKDPYDGGKENDGPSRHSFGVVVSIADGGHSDEDAPKAVAVILETSLQTWVVQKKYSF